MRIGDIPAGLDGTSRVLGFLDGIRLRLVPLLLAPLVIVGSVAAFSATAASVTARPRILVCTDIGGTDFDDFQSMVHLLVYADRFDIVGLVSSPTGGPGRKADILKVIRCYEQDYQNLKTYSDQYPAPEALRDVCKQGAIHSPGLSGFGTPTEGSEWIIHCAEQPDSRPLWILDWAGLDDVAQALHDCPAIESRVRVYFIGGPNKKWCVPAYYYIMRRHPKLWIIENNSTYRGWFLGGDQNDEWSNAGFVAKYVAGRGAMGNFFAGLTLNGKSCDYIKMGDTPSVAYMLGDDPLNPEENKSWGGQFVRAWTRPYRLFDHAEENPPTRADNVEAFGVVEIRYHFKAPGFSHAEAALLVDGQRFTGFADKQGIWHFLFSPKMAKLWKYKIESTLPNLNGRTGAFTSYWPPAGLASRPSSTYPNWWTDNPAPALADDGWQGARTISKDRVDFLRDFAARIERCKMPATPHGD